MELTSAVDLILDILVATASLLQSLSFSVYGVTVSFWGICLVFIVIGLVCAVFWKGASQ